MVDDGDNIARGGRREEAAFSLELPGRGVPGGRRGRGLLSAPAVRARGGEGPPPRRARRRRRRGAPPPGAPAPRRTPLQRHCRLPILTGADLRLACRPPTRGPGRRPAPPTACSRRPCASAAIPLGPTVRRPTAPRARPSASSCGGLRRGWVGVDPWLAGELAGGIDDIPPAGCFHGGRRLAYSHGMLPQAPTRDRVTFPRAAHLGV